MKKAIEFTPTELKIIKFICKQRSSDEMAGDLELSIRTVEGYRRRILSKMKVKNVAGLVIFAIKNGLYNIR